MSLSLAQLSKCVIKANDKPPWMTYMYNARLTGHSGHML